MKKYILIYYILTAMGMVSVSQTATFPSFGDGTIGNPYQISSLENLYWIAANYERAECHFVQTSVIDATETSSWFSGQGWLPIGTILPFTGTYNGNGFLIKGIYINRTTEEGGVGLFGKLQNAQIRNLVLTDFNVTGNSQVGGLAGNAGGRLIIENCNVFGNINGTAYVGGLIGNSYQRPLDGNPHFINCESSATVIGINYIGGLVGNANYSNFSDCIFDGTVAGSGQYAGGMTGSSNYCTIVDCSNSGSVTGNSDVGGIVGTNSLASLIYNCFNTGDVGGISYVGGLGGTNGGIIDSGYSTGKITGTENLGGLVGQSYGSIIDCYSLGEVEGEGNQIGGLAGKCTALIVRCYSSGLVSGNDYIGGLCGYFTGDLRNSHSDGEVNGNDYVGGLIGYSYNPGKVSICYSTAEVNGHSNIGGLIGARKSASTTYCFSTGAVLASGDYAGGLVGKTESGFTTNCYSTSSISGNNYVGGLIGHSSMLEQIDFCYSIGAVSGIPVVGGLLAYCDNNFVHPPNRCYWDVETSGQIISDGGEGRTTSQMTVPYDLNTYVEWNFTTVWGIDDAFFEGYPTLINQQHDILILPVVKATTATNITTTIVDIEGSVIYDGASQVSQRGICWSTTTEVPTIAGSHTDDGSCIGEFTGHLSFLSPATVYFVRAYAINSTGIAYGNIMKIRTEAGALPFVLTSQVADVHATSATAEGQIISEGGTPVTLYGFCISTNLYPTRDNHSLNFQGNPGGIFSSALQNLTQLTKYYLRAYAVNGAGIEYGNQVSFTTLAAPVLPVVTTDTISSITQTTATGGGNVTTDGGAEVTARGIVWSAIQNPTIVFNEGITADSAGLGNFTSSLSGLQPATPYFVKAYASNSQGTAYGEELNFTTLPLAEPIEPEGTGTNEDPYLIANENNLLWLFESETDWDKSFVQTADIGASKTLTLNKSAGWPPIGNDAVPFTGNYDGNGYTIDGLFINQPGAFYYLGLFGYISGATITNLGVINVDVTGGYCVGALVGSGSFSSITNCYSTGNLNGNDWIGSLVGTIYYSTLTNCYSTANAEGTNYVGGLVGVNEGSSTISNCYSKGSVNGVSNIGGLVGMVYSSTIEFSYSTGFVNGSSYAGGLVGYNEDAFVENSYWNIETSGQTSGAGGLGRITSEMTYPYPANTFTGWNFDGMWIADEYFGTNNGYPYLFWQPSILVTIPEVSTTSITEIGYTSAISGGIVINNGGAEVYSRGTVWSSSQNPTLELNEGFTVDGAGLGEFISNLAGLGPNTQYYVRAYATNIVGTAYGEEITFNTLEDEVGFAGGSGSIEDPYLVANAAQLDNVRNYLSAYFRQIADIDLGVATWNGGEGWIPIGNGWNWGLSFSGSYDGNGYFIDGLVINRSENDNQGLFGFTNFGAIIKNTGITNVNITAKNNVGALVGSNYVTTIVNCFSTGMVNGHFYVGGLIGYNNSSEVSNNFSNAEVNGESYLGGLLGENYYSAVQDCYSTGYVSGSIISYGGLIGSGNYSTVENCYWDTETSGQSTSVGGEGRTTSEMTYPYAANTYVGWNFTDIWHPDINSNVNNGYPYLFWRQPQIILPTVTTALVSGITETTAICGGDVTDDGGTQVTGRGIVWSSVQNPTLDLNEGFTMDGEGLGEFNSNLTGLSPNTGYFVKAYAKNSKGIAYGEQIQFTTLNTNTFVCGTSTINDNDGNIYNTVLINNQCWMQENLKTTTYSNGIPIPNVTDGSNWSNLTSGAYAWYSNSITWKDLYGAIYNGYAVNNENGLCPNGWRVPADVEWTQLTDFIGGLYSANKLKSCRQVNSPIGGECNTFEHPRWDSHSIQYGTDDYNFAALPGGYRIYTGGFHLLGIDSYWWSSTESNPSNNYIRILNYNTNTVTRTTYGKKNGYSVRCVMDENSQVHIPTISTAEITEITSSTVITGGNVSNDGGAEVTVRGVCWSSAENPSIDDNDGFTTDGAGLGGFVSNITGLMPSNNYFVRAYATNYIGTAYGEQLQFVTLSGGPPNWETNPYLQYNMQIIARLEYADGTISVNANDIVGAFVGDECRGVMSPDPGFMGIMFLTVSSNTQSGETITFKGYLSDVNNIVELNQTLIFQNQKQVGSMANPFIYTYHEVIAHTITLSLGWSGISAYLIPDDPEVENIFAPVQDELVILQNFDGMYWPFAGVNTLGNWDDHAGYQVKMESAGQVTFTGILQDNLTINLNPGWNYLPVLNTCDNPVEELFNPIAGHLQIVKEVAGWGVYWPQFGVNTLGEIIPGKAYFVLVDEAGSLEFPVCGKVGLTHFQDLSGLDCGRTLSGLGTEITQTPITHSIAIPKQAISGLENGEIIIVYNQNGRCCGAVLYQTQNFVLTAFGDDPTTPQTDGMTDGEAFIFKVFNPASVKEFPLIVEFDEQMPQSGYFMNNGISAVKRLQTTGIGDDQNLDMNIWIYPNPSTGLFKLQLDRANPAIFMEITNIQGSVIVKENVKNQDFTIDLSSYPKGMYYLKITKGGLQIVKKLVLE